MQNINANTISFSSCRFIKAIRSTILGLLINMAAIFLQKSKWLNSSFITHSITTIINNTIQYITLHIAPYQQSRASKAAAVNVFRNWQKDPTKHPHYKNHIGSIGFEHTIPSPSKIISEDTTTTHFHWKKQQHI